MYVFKFCEVSFVPFIPQASRIVPGEICLSNDFQCVKKRNKQTNMKPETLQDVYKIEVSSLDLTAAFAAFIAL